MFTDQPRISDENIYLNENLYEKPKESNKFLEAHLFNHLKTNNLLNQSLKLLDVGCATGALVYFLDKRFPQLKYFGLDISSTMILEAKNKNPRAIFKCASALDKGIWGEEKFDIISFHGTIAIFDEIEELLNIYLELLNPNGVIFMFDMFNDEPIDMIMRYRRVGNHEHQGIWEPGGNCFSLKTLETIAQKSSKKIEYYNFNMPFPLDKKDDPMRSWTIETKKNPHQLVWGTKQLMDMYLVKIY